MAKRNADKDVSPSAEGEEVFATSTAPIPFKKGVGSPKLNSQKQWLNTIVFEGSRTPNPAFSFATKGTKKNLTKIIHELQINKRRSKTVSYLFLGFFLELFNNSLLCVDLVDLLGYALWNAFGVFKIVKA